MNLKCSNSTHKLTVKWANYGRTSQTRCKQGHHKNATAKTNCGASNSLKKVKDACNGRNSCSVQADNNTFGEPCHGTYKYLEVKYVCE